MFSTKKHTTIASKQGEKMKKICLISAWFGKFPNNMQYFLESVRYNRTIDFLCYSDVLESTLEYALPDNFHIINTTFEEFHDFDMVFGDIRRFFTDEILSNNDRILIHGHLSLFRNEDKINHVCLEGSSKQNLMDVVSSVETIAYDEMLGMRLAFQERGLKQYVNPGIWVDIVESINHVVNNNRYNRLKQFYMWDDGKLWWCVKKKGKIVRLRELVYVHFQKRKMYCDTFEEKRPFYIYNKDITYVIKRVHRKLSK